MDQLASRTGSSTEIGFFMVIQCPKIRDIRRIFTAKSLVLSQVVRKVLQVQW